MGRKLQQAGTEKKEEQKQKGENRGELRLKNAGKIWKLGVRAEFGEAKKTEEKLKNRKSFG